MATTQEKSNDKLEELAASKAAALEAFEKFLDAKTHFRLAAEAAGMELKDDVTEHLLQGRDKAAALGHQAEAYCREKPLTTLGIAFVAGFIFAQLFSRK